MDVLFSDLGIRPVPLVYEDLLSDPLGVLQGISRHLGVTPPAEQPMTTLRTLRNEQTERWRERFMRELPQELREVVDLDVRRRGVTYASGQDRHEVCRRPRSIHVGAQSG